MSNKKHIDRVFQEKLKDFEVSPSPKVWQNIKGELDQSDQNKKVFPIWMRLAGVAALLLLLFTIGNGIRSNSSDSNKTNEVVDTENTLINSDSGTDNINANNSVGDSQNTNQDGLVTDVNSPELNSETETNPLNNKANVSGTINGGINNSDVATTKPSEANSNLLNNKANVSGNVNDVTNNLGVTGTNPSNLNTNLSNKITSSEDKDSYSSASNKDQKRNESYTNAVAQNNNTEPTSKASNIVTENKTPLNNSEKANSSNNPIANNNGDVSSTPTITEGVAQNNSEKLNNNSNTIPEFDKDKADDVMKNGTNDALAENQSNSEALEKQEDTTTDEETEEDSPSIEEEIAKAEDIIEEEEEKVDRWQVYANVAPVYYNTLGKGSHIDDQFVQNSKSGEVNTSYGVNVSYVLNDKLKLRSGFSSLNLSYDTDDVILYENVGNNPSSAAAPRNLDLTTTGQSFSAISATNLGAQQLGNGIGSNSNGAISQRIAYYEVPLELEYNLVDNKFGINVIGGFSTFILNENKVFSEFDGRKTEVGEANNINNVSFSGNLGLGLDYKFSNKIKLNVQPTFKYQLNAYKNTSGNFRPYIVGVYTGLSYKF